MQLISIHRRRRIYCLVCRSHKWVMLQATLESRWCIRCDANPGASSGSYVSLCRPGCRFMICSVLMQSPIWAHLGDVSSLRAPSLAVF